MKKYIMNDDLFADAANASIARSLLVTELEERFRGECRYNITQPEYSTRLKAYVLKLDIDAGKGTTLHKEVLADSVSLVMGSIEKHILKQEIEEEILLDSIPEALWEV